MTSKSTTIKLLSIGLDDIWLRIYRKEIELLANGYGNWNIAVNRLESIDKKDWELLQLIKFLQFKLEENFRESKSLEEMQNEFKHNFNSAVSSEERRAFLFQVALKLKYEPKQIKKIKRRHLDWFDESAVADRFDRLYASIEKQSAFIIRQLCELVIYALSSVNQQFIGEYWRQIDLPKSLLKGLLYQHQQHIQIEASKGLRRVLQRYAARLKEPLPTEFTQYIFRICLDRDMSVWKRAEVITLIAITDVNQYKSIIEYIYNRETNVDIFLKGRLVESTLRYLGHKNTDENYVDDDTCFKAEAENFDNVDDFTDKHIAYVLSQDSDYVLQRLAEFIYLLSDNKCISVANRLFDSSISSQVKAQLVATLCKHRWEARYILKVIELILNQLRLDAEVFLTRTILFFIPKLLLMNKQHKSIYKEVIRKVDAKLTLLNLNHESTRVRRWSAEARETLNYYFGTVSTLARDVENKLFQLPLHSRVNLSLEKPLNENDYRRLAYISKNRFGFDVEDKGGRLKIISGFKFGFRFWRFLHELKTSATDKRQNHNHLKGRVYYGLNQCNSRIMAEQSITKVPGEPVYFDEEAGERNYLPLVDQLISSLDQGWPTRAMKIYSCEGVTEILPPSGFVSRLITRLRLQLHFKKFARLRNWQEGDSFEPPEFLRQVRELGFKVQITGYTSNSRERYPIEPRVQRFFPSLAIPFALPSLSDAQNYFYSVYQNSISQLLGFTAIFSAGFLSFHLKHIYSLRKNRNAIPLVVGGWGTRGKSGTERLKAAVFSELGLSVVSKTTGCEAMFLYGGNNRPLKELFLFRPYDKATIWEQVFLTKFSAKLKVDVFLWECMGLTPRYIDILQNQWMKDDISTITNCYPDHEDIQGPAGIEIPIVMQNFITKAGKVFTSEESMLPLLEDAALQKKTSLRSVNWFNSGLITEDLLKRFPYEEHPNNIALVQKMAESLGVRSDVALKAMADRVVADLGVLRIYPVASVRGRTIEFINGMSANERLGAMGNWHRTGLSACSLEANPHNWLSVVINNRADRVARSKVFADMMVSDMFADRYYLIGDNLDGFMTYTKDAWYQRYNKLISKGDQQNKLSSFTNLVKRHRIITNEKTIKLRLSAMLKPLIRTESQKSVLATIESSDLDLVESIVKQWYSGKLFTSGVSEKTVFDVLKYFNQDVRELEEWQKQERALQKTIDSESVKDFIDWLFERFKMRWVVVEDYFSSGHQTLNIVIESTPPGLHTKLIGVQNIKGTGLDFIYRWQAWDQVYKHCNTLIRSRQLVEVQRASRALAVWEEFGLLEEPLIQESISFAKQRQVCQQESVQADFEVIKNKAEFQILQVKKSLEAEVSSNNVWMKLIKLVEAFLDAGDAVRRKKRANEIYKALENNLISVERATVELAELTKAQKGGWLIKAVKQKLQVN